MKEVYRSIAAGFIAALVLSFTPTEIAVGLGIVALVVFRPRRKNFH